MLSNVTTVIYIITGEHAGIQKICEAFSTKEDWQKAFEEKTGFTWQQYLDGKYNYKNTGKNGYYYRCFEVEQVGDTKETKVALRVDIACYSRSLLVEVNRPQADQAAAIMDKRYDVWAEGTQEDTIDTCCEEYILEGLKEAGIPFTYEFEEEADN